MLKINIEKYQDYAPVAVRIGMAIVFLWFGISQIMTPAQFAGWIPAEAAFIPLEAETLVFLNGIFETIFGILLIIGLYTRISALLLGLHLAVITASIGFTEIGIRDLGLAIATLSIVLQGPDKWSLDKKFNRPLRF